MRLRHGRLGCSPIAVHRPRAAPAAPTASTALAAAFAGGPGGGDIFEHASEVPIVPATWPPEEGRVRRACHASPRAMGWGGRNQGDRGGSAHSIIVHATSSSGSCCPERRSTSLKVCASSRLAASTAVSEISAHRPSLAAISPVAAATAAVLVAHAA